MLVQGQDLSPEHLPTSVYLTRLLDHADGERVTFGWLLNELGERSFGLTLFLLALLAFVPGVASVSSILILWPALQMLLGHDAVVFPGIVMRLEVRVYKLNRAIRLAAPRIAWVERLIRPRWPTSFHSIKRLAGITIFLLGLTMMFPVPLGQLLPAIIVMLMALAYLEKDGLALMVGVASALISLAVTMILVWGTIETIDWLDPAVRNP